MNGTLHMELSKAFKNGWFYFGYDADGQLHIKYQTNGRGLRNAGLMFKDLEGQIRYFMTPTDERSKVPGKHRGSWAV